MAYRTTEKAHWIHVEYLDEIDSFDLIEQASEEAFMQSLARKKKVIYDYSSVTKVDLNDDQIKQLAALGRLHGSLHEHIDVAVVLKSERGLDKAKLYQSASHDSQWQVTICMTLAEAEQVLSV